MNIADPVFQSFLQAEGPRIILLADVPNFTIVAYNEAYTAAAHTRYRDIVGWYLHEVFNPAQACREDYELLLNALTTAVKNNKHLLTEPFRYDIPSTDAGGMEECWWQTDIRPVTGSSGSPSYLLLKTTRLPIMA